MTDTQLPDLPLPALPSATGKVARERRVCVRLPSAVTLASGQWLEGTSSNISVGGAAILISPEWQEHVTIGHKVRLQLSDLVNVEATVVWLRNELRDHRGQPALGVGLKYAASNLSVLAPVQRLIAEYRPLVVVVEGESSQSGAAENALRDHYNVRTVTSNEQALAAMDTHEIAVLVLDLLIPEMTGRALLSEIDRRFPNSRAVRIVLSEQSDDSGLRDFIAACNIFYLLKKPVGRADLKAIVNSATEEYFSRLRQHDDQVLSEQATTVQKVLEFSRRLAIQRDPITAGSVAVEAIEELTAADRAYYHIYDSITDSLWTRAPGNEQLRQQSAATGLTGFVARTGNSVHLAHAGDARYNRSVDDPQGSGQEPFLAAPVKSADGRVLAVLAALRVAERPPFSEEDKYALELLATHASSSFSQAQLQAKVEKIFAGSGIQAPSLFREEAFKAQYGQHTHHGDLLRITPRWTHYTYWVLVSLFVAGLLFTIFGKVDEFASGPAVLMAEEQTALTARASGTVARVHVEPTQHVAAGEALIELYAAEEEAEFERVDRQFEAALAESLKTPSDEQARKELATLRTQRDLVRARLEERIIRAPRAGIISDVRVRQGQVVQAGVEVISFEDESSSFFLVAMINGKHRPMIEAGMPLKLELTGFEYSYQTLYVDSVSDEILGPEEARNYLGSSIAESMGITGPVAVVRAHLPSRSFSFRGKKFQLHSGMLGAAELRVRSSRIITTLIPGLSEI